MYKRVRGGELLRILITENVELYEVAWYTDYVIVRWIGSCEI